MTCAYKTAATPLQFIRLFLGLSQLADRYARPRRSLTANPHPKHWVAQPGQARQPEPRNVLRRTVVLQGCIGVSWIRPVRLLCLVRLGTVRTAVYSRVVWVLRERCRSAALGIPEKSLLPPATVPQSPFITYHIIPSALDPAWGLDFFSPSQLYY